MKGMLLLTMAVPLVGLSGPESGDVELVAARTEVAIAVNAPQTVVFAAGEMTNFLSRVFGVRIPLVRKPTPGLYTLFLGDSPEVRAAGINVGRLPHDGFEVCVTANAAYIAGADDPEQDLVRIAARHGPNGVHGAHATLFGTYDFLERFAGCRFYFPGRLGEIVPRAATLRLPKGRYRSAPSFTLRRFSVMDKNFGIWPARDRISDAEWRRATNLEVYRLRMETEHIPFCHGQSKIRLSERFPETHPEWFALQGGKRRTTWDKNKPSSSSQMCITSGYWEEIYQDARSYLSGEPASIRKPARGKVRRQGKLEEDWVWLWHAKYRKYFDVMPNDGMAKCQCENCRAAYAKAKDPKDGWATEVVWGHTVDMAKRLTAEGIGGYLTQMAYGPYSGIPDFAIPTNVLVMLARTGAWSVLDRERWERDNALVKAWSAKVNGNLALWNYPGKYECAGTSIPEVPSGAPHAMGTYLKSVAPYVIGTYQESESDRFFFNYLTLYVFSRIAWDASVDPEAIIDEHDRFMFGPAAATMHEYILTQENIWLTNVVGNVMYSSLGPKIAPPSEYELWTRIYGEETMARLKGLLDKAIAEAGAGTVEAERIELYRAETFKPLAAARRAYLEAVDIGRECAYRKDHPEVVARNLVRNGDFEKSYSGWRRNTTSPSNVFEWDASDGVAGVGCLHLKAEGPVEQRGWKLTWRVNALQLLEGKRALKPSTRYRLSYYVKIDGVVPLKGRGGVAAAVIDGSGTTRFFPERKLRGTLPWLRQSFTFETGPETDGKNRSQLRLAISVASGEARFDGVLLEELGPAGG